MVDNSNGVGWAKCGIYFAHMWAKKMWDFRPFLRLLWDEVWDFTICCVRCGICSIEPTVNVGYPTANVGFPPRCGIFFIKKTNSNKHF